MGPARYYRVAQVNGLRGKLNRSAQSRGVLNETSTTSTIGHCGLIYNHVADRSVFDPRQECLLG